MNKYNYGSTIMKIYRAKDHLKENVEILKRNGGYNEYYKCILIMHSNKVFEDTLKSALKTVNLNDLIKESLFPILSLEGDMYSEANFYKDLEFIEAYFDVNKDYIKDFLHLKSKFEHEFLNGLRKEAEETLSQIEKIFGISFWLIESKLLLYNECDYKKYASYYSKIKNLCENDLLKNHFRLIKRRVNLRTRTRDYETFFVENIEKYSRDDDWSSKIYGYYTRFMSFQTHQVLSDEMKKSLGIMLYHLTFVDAWILFKKVILSLRVTESNRYIKNIFQKYKSVFCSDDLERANYYHRIKEAFCEENYTECLKDCEIILKKHGNYFEILDLYIKCIVLTETNVILQSDDSPLLKLSDVLAKCYIKEDDSDYAFTYIDYCDRYNRALCMFSSYYELLSIVENTMEPWNKQSTWSLFIKLYDREFLNEESICIQEDRVNYIEEMRKYWNVLYTCEWNYTYRKKFYDIVEKKDYVSKVFNKIDNGEITSINWKNEMSYLEKLFYEECVVNKFQLYVNKEMYMEAIHLYIEVYIKSIFLVLKMDVERLEARLSSSIRRGMLSEIDYFVFLDIGRKRREEKNVFDQAMVDSFVCILKKYNIKKPSDIIPLDEKPSENILMFWEGCCNRILNESPCDLYDEEEIEEEILLLNKIIERKPKNLYKDWLAKLELKHDYAEITKLYARKEWITDKIIADEILLENDDNIMSSYDELCGLSMQQILINAHKVSLFREVFAACKKEYVRQVNEQMGSRIRHSILDTEFVQLLKKFNLFFPLCNKREKEIIFQHNEYLLNLSTVKKSVVFKNLQNCCITLFENIGLAKKELLFFTHEKFYGEYTSMYVDIDELKRYMQRMDDISNETRFITEIKTILDNILVERLYLLRDRVKNRLQNIKEEYINNLQKIVREDDIFIDLIDLENEMDCLISKIVAWFNLFSNGDQECEFKTYWYEQAQIYSDFQFKCVIDSEHSQKLKLKVIRDIDMILKNMIRNIQLHSGYAANLRNANASFIIKISSKNHITLETNNLVTSFGAPQNMNKKAVKSSYDVGLEDGTGEGYHSIKNILSNNYVNPKIDRDIKDNVFRAKIEFDLEKDFNSRIQ